MGRLVSCRTVRTGAAAGAAALAVAALGLGAGPARGATTGPRPGVLAGTHPSWATAATDSGITPAATRVAAQVYLASRAPAALAAYASAVSAPGSARYHQYLTPARQQAWFGPSAAQVSRVRAWLRQAGLRVTASTEQYISVAGPAAAVRRAFGTRLRNYTLSGHLYHAPARNAVVPAALATAVLAVSGLNNAPALAHPTAVPAAELDAGTTGSGRAAAAAAARTQPGRPPFVGPTPCSAYWGQRPAAGLPPAYGHASPLPVCGYTPRQLRGAYGVPGTGLAGRGTTVAVVDAYGSATIASDVNSFARFNGIPSFAPGQFRQVVTPDQWNSQGACGGPAGWKPEESLDIEAVHTMAPAARVTYVGANSCTDADLMAALGAIVSRHLASIVTNSWSGLLFDYNAIEPPGTIQAYTQLLQQGATEGIGFYFASGDCSTNDPVIAADGLNCDPNSSQPQAAFPAADPWATAVGGTAIGIGRRGSRLFETGMGDSEAVLQHGTTWSDLPGTFLFGAGGGTSNYFRQPYYQSAVVPYALAHNLLTGAYSAAPMRVVPDVAMEGDLLAATMVGFTQQLPGGGTGFAEAGYGGTSVATPLFAGLQADAQQAAGYPIGFANPALYAVSAQPGLHAFRDITDHPGGQTYAAAIGGGTAGGVLQGLLLTLGSDWTLHAVPGYDTVTGIGSPAPRYLTSLRRPG
jgi:subtilase family serine protease